MNQIFSLNHPQRSILWSSQHRVIKDLILIFLGIALLALSAQFVIPLKPVPLTFQSATVVLLGLVYGTRLGILTMLGYLMAGAFGIPVFASLSSGLGALVGTTSGYLFGFIPAALLGGFLAQRGWSRTVLGAFVAACLSASIIFLTGVSVLSHFIGWHSAFLLGLVPFVVTEPLKLLAVAMIVPSFWKSMK